MTQCLPMDQKYLKKKVCVDTAIKLIKEDKVLDMKVEDCAKEIFAHAIAHYTSAVLSKLKINCDFITKHTTIIDLEDGGDKLERRLAYELIWKMTPPG